MPNIELLAPAKNFEFGKSAINCGADAVYIGAPKFGARSAALNSLNSIEQLVLYAHKFKAKVYVALNTLLFDKELNEAQKLIHDLWNLGADAIIIQDMGILEMELPPIPLFASTQTHNDNWQKVLFLEKNGIQRVILARELSLSQIKEIRSYTTVELECFVHGSICVCYSGQCYMSQAIAGKSGNRGECIQPCRWDYTLKNSDNNILIEKKHLLSPKDLNLNQYLKPLLDAGITSFKIEGRLKDISYVKNITSWYRRQIDAIIEGNDIYARASSGKTSLHFIPDPSRTFNRGFTDYFIDKRQRQIASFNSPKSIGMAVGEVLKIENNSIKIKSYQEISNGDGLCFFDTQNVLQGFRVNRSGPGVIFPAEMPEIIPGSKLYRNHDQQFESFLLKNDETRKITVNLFIKETSSGISLQAVDEDGFTINTTIETEKTIAREPEQSLENIRVSLKKSGNSIFEVRSISIELNNVYFFPASVMNELRRTAFNLLENKRMIEYFRKEVKLPPTAFEYFEKELFYNANILNHKSKSFYEKRGSKIIEQGFENLNDYKNKALMTTRYCIKFETGNCLKHQNQEDKNWNKSLFLENDKNRFRLEFDCKECVMKIFKE